MHAPKCLLLSTLHVEIRMMKFDVIRVGPSRLLEIQTRLLGIGCVFSLEGPEVPMENWCFVQECARRLQAIRIQLVTHKVTPNTIESPHCLLMNAMLALNQNCSQRVGADHRGDHFNVIRVSEIAFLVRILNIPSQLTIWLCESGAYDGGSGLISELQKFSEVDALNVHVFIQGPNISVSLCPG